MRVAAKRRLKTLAVAIADLLQELQQTRCALWQREAELAAGVPVMAHPDEQMHLAERLESVLKAGAQAVGCQAAAIYLLDDATRKLKLRACWGLPRSRFADSPRPLRGATADLEALIGHAVIVRNAELLPNWQIPEEFRSAVCVPISSPTTPFGTLWVFCDHGRDFSVDETNLIEIVAGRIAADLERAVLLNQTLKLRSLARQLTHAAQWQQHRLPRIKPMLPGWDLSGWTAQAGALGGDFHDWFVLHGGDLAVAVGDAQGKMFESGLTTATLHTALLRTPPMGTRYSRWLNASTKPCGPPPSAISLRRCSMRTSSRRRARSSMSQPATYMRPWWAIRCAPWPQPTPCRWGRNRTATMPPSRTGWNVVKCSWRSAKASIGLCEEPASGFCGD